ncbi:hypothetical protein D3C87_1630070 [compost metagenome]
MSFKQGYIRYHNRFVPFPGSAANALAERDTGTGQRSLEGSQYQVICCGVDQVKPDPEPGELFAQYRTDIRHIGDCIAFRHT